MKFTESPSRKFSNLRDNKKEIITSFKEGSIKTNFLIKNDEGKPMPIT